MEGCLAIYGGMLVGLRGTVLRVSETRNLYVGFQLPGSFYVVVAAVAGV